MTASEYPPGPPPGSGRELWHAARSACGNCPECGRALLAGDIIRHDGTGGYLCSDCGDTGPGVHVVRVRGDLL
jgi:predicted RNA-binding Zn-ribbon protein involved in translation (DUF1610 family)